MSAKSAASRIESAARLEPSEASPQAAALRILRRHRDQLMRTARRYAGSPHDADDAVQRGLEILLAKAPRVPDDELLAWLKTVIKHEAFAIRRQHRRVLLDGEATMDGNGDLEAAIDSEAPSPFDHLERYERLRLGAEALRHLKPQESRALSLLAQGYSYRQICEETGWTYTKVNRCLAEGRQSFREQLALIESGEECRRLEPELSALARGEGGAGEITQVRQHLRNCVGCRATLRRLQVPGMVLPLSPLSIGSLVRESRLRVSESLAALKLKVEGVWRTLLQTGGGTAETTVSESVRGLLGTASAKVLALICLSSAGAGGAVAGIDALSTESSRTAQAAGLGLELAVRGDRGSGHSADGRIVAERSGDAGRREEVGSPVRPSRPAGAALGSPARDHSPEPRAAVVDAPSTGRDSRTGGTPARQDPSAGGGGGSAPAPAAGGGHDSEYGSGVPESHGNDTEYGSGVPGDGSYDTEYGSGVPGDGSYDTEYGSGVPAG